jgi:hypothetical protein
MSINQPLQPRLKSRFITQFLMRWLDARWNAQRMIGIRYEILIDSIDNVDLTSLSGLPAETILDVIKTTGDTTANIKTFLTVDGYQMRVEAVEKRIAQEDGKWIVYNEAGTRSFGSYDSKEES